MGQGDRRALFDRLQIREDVLAALRHNRRPIRKSRQPAWKVAGTWSESALQCK